MSRMNIKTILQSPADFTPVDGSFTSLYNQETVASLLRSMQNDPSLTIEDCLKNQEIKFRGINAKNETIAVVGHTYHFVTNTELIAAVESAFESNGIKMVRADQMSDKSNRVHTFNWIYDRQFVINGDIHYYGFEVKDSYGGLTPVQGNLMLYRLACNNGMMVKKASEKVFNMRHDSKLNLDRVFFDIDQMVQEYEMAVKIIERMPEVKVVVDPTLLKNLEELYGNRTANNILETYESVYALELGRNVYSLMNAATHYASHDVNSFSGRQKLNKVNQTLFADGKIFDLIGNVATN